MKTESTSVTKANTNAAKEDWKQAGIKAEPESANQHKEQSEARIMPATQLPDSNQVGQTVSPPKPPTELKPLPNHLKYTYLGDEQQFQKEKLLQVLKQHKKAIGWKLSDLPRINPSICMHRILMEEEARPVVPKKSRMTVMKNQNDELVPTRVQNSWRIHIAPEDQHKTTFTCPFGTFAYTRMPFGLCNAPSTFQRCMLSIFSDLLEDCMEVFMDDFTVYADTFDACLGNLARVLKRCIKTSLVLNFEKCHFMVAEGIVLNHLVSSRGIEVDKAKIDIITSLLNPSSVRVVRSFLGHVGFYRRFIKNFNKTALPLSTLLQKDVEFDFNKECIQAFEELKTILTSTPILQAPNWELQIELMCNASNSALGAVLD
ncbi:Retrovirus-related Pol polyprotein from transposon 17.6, partial [Mucuna pruriens]